MRTSTQWKGTTYFLCMRKYRNTKNTENKLIYSNVLSVFSVNLVFVTSYLFVIIRLSKTVSFDFFSCLIITFLKTFPPIIIGSFGLNGIMDNAISCSKIRELSTSIFVFIEVDLFNSVFLVPQEMRSKRINKYFINSRFQQSLRYLHSFELNLPLLRLPIATEKPL